MIYPSISIENPLIFIELPKKSTFNSYKQMKIKILCSNKNKPPSNTKKINTFTNPIVVIPNPNKNQNLIAPSQKRNKINKINVENFEDSEETNDNGSKMGLKQMMILCGYGYWVQGFRYFPWLALNFHMAHILHLHPSTLQLVQNAGNLPMVAKPFYGILSDALYIGGAHRIPYISIGALLQILSWGPLALIPAAAKTLPTLMSCVLLSNLGASLTEVANDALIAEYDHKHKMGGLQSYAFMALAAGGILANLLGGFLLLKAHPKNMFLVFTVLLTAQLAISLRTNEASLGLPRPLDKKVDGKLFRDGLRKQFSDLIVAVQDDKILKPIVWIVASIALIPSLSGSIFCYQTQILNLDTSIIGMARVVGQILLLSTTVLYDKYWKKVPMRKVIRTLQIVYAFSLLFDLVLVQQINLKVGIPNDIFALCFSGLAETIAQFKILPFAVLIASLCPPGCEGSVTSFLASVCMLSSIVSGFLGIGVASLVGITSSDYSSLPMGIFVQFVIALIPLGWMHYVPMWKPILEKEKKKRGTGRGRRMRRLGRMVYNTLYSYRSKRET